MTADDPGREARRAETAEREARRARLTAQWGEPERISPADALALARTALVPVDLSATADDVYASIYRDDAAADGWLESNLTHHGHPALAKVPLPDGRVVGILDLRPEMAKSRARIREYGTGYGDGCAGRAPAGGASEEYLEGHREGLRERDSGGEP